jgi:MFS family permease
VASSSYGSAVLRIRDFRFLIINKFLLTFGVQMVNVTAGWHIYQLTRDPLSLGLIGLSEAAAFISFALWAGRTADRVEKRRVILRAESMVLLCVFGLWFLAWSESAAVFPIYVLFAVSGIARAFLWTSSASFSQQIVPTAIYSSAAAWNASVYEIACVLGPAAGGLLTGLWGPRYAYGIATLSVAAALVFAFRLNRHPPAPSPEKEDFFQSLSAGLRFVFRHQVLLATMLLDMFAVLFGGVVALLPIFAEMLKVGPVGLGLLRASQSVGAIIMALAQTRRPPFQNTGRTLLYAVSVFGLCIIAFGLSKNFYLSMVLLALAGAADNISVVIRSSILQAATPDHMRGRVSAINGIFIGSSNELGAFESGVAAKLVGTVPAVLFGGIMTLLTVGATMWKFPRLRKLKSVTNIGLEAGGFNTDIRRDT